MLALKSTFASLLRLGGASIPGLTPTAGTPLPNAANTISAAEIDGVPIEDHGQLMAVRYEAGLATGSAKIWQGLDVSTSLAPLRDAGFVLDASGYLGLPRRGLNALLLGKRDEAGHLWALALLLGAPGSVAPGGTPMPAPVWRQHAKDWIAIPSSDEGKTLALKLQASLESRYPHCAIYLVVDGEHANTVLALRRPCGANHPVAAHRLAFAIDHALNTTTAPAGTI